MKKVLCLLLVVGLAVPVAADTTRGRALAGCIHLIEDSAVLSLFPSRLPGLRSAVFLRVGDLDSGAKNTVFLPGVQLIQPSLSLSYYYGRPLGITPPMLAHPGLGFTSASYAAPISLILGTTLGSTSLALAYTLGIYSTDNIDRYADGSLSNYQVARYQIHQIQPSLTLSLGKSSLDASLWLGLHLLRNTDQTPGLTNQVYAGSLLHSLGVQAQYTRPFSDRLTAGLRLGFGLTNLGYTDIDGWGVPGALTNVYTRMATQLDLTAGLQFGAAPGVDIYFDILSGYQSVYQQDLAGGTNVVSGSDVRRFILPVSTRLGIEFVKGPWSFRLAVRTAMTATQTRNGNDTATVFGPLSTRAVIGLGWAKGDWIVNTVLNPALFNDTVYLVSGSSLQPVLQLSVNYLFPRPAVKGQTIQGGDGSQ